MYVYIVYAYVVDLLSLQETDEEEKKSSIYSSYICMNINDVHNIACGYWYIILSNQTILLMYFLYIYVYSICM